MTVHDYIGGVPCYLFPQIRLEIISTKNLYGEIVHTGGRFRKYEIGDSLPLQTVYYHYPKNFYLVDSTNMQELICVSQGVYKGTIFIENQDIDYLLPFYETSSLLLAITNADNYYAYFSEYEKLIKKLIAIRNNFKENKTKKKDIVFSVFSASWFKLENPNDIYIKFGELLYLLKTCTDLIERNIIKRKVNELLVREDSTFIQRYLKWVNEEEEIITEEDLLMSLE